MSMEYIEQEKPSRDRAVAQCGVDTASPWDFDAVRRSNTITLVTFVLCVWMIFLFIVFSASGPITPREEYQKRVIRKKSIADKKPPRPRKKNIKYEPNSKLLTLDMATLVSEGSGITKQHRSVNGHPIRINGAEYAHGIGTHAKSEIIVPLNKEFKRFVAEVGIDDEVYDPQCTPTDANAVFQIFVDDKRVYNSGLLKHTRNAKPVDVSVAGAKVLRLVVLGGRNGTHCDRGDWAAARLIK